MRLVVAGSRHRLVSQSRSEKTAYRSRLVLAAVENHAAMLHASYQASVSGLHRPRLLQCAGAW
jgi:hypothetical protein